MKSDSGWTKAFLSCQQAKVNRQSSNPLSTFAPPSARFDAIHLDLVGPLPHSNGYMYLLTVIDRFTHWPEALPLPDIKAENVAQIFLQGWIARFGTPTTITTDRGSQFESGLWSDLMVALGTKHLRTTACHPQANGLIERFYRQLKGALKCHFPQHQWTEALPWALLGIRSAVKEDSKCTCTTAEMIYSRCYHIPCCPRWTPLSHHEPAHRDMQPPAGLMPPQPAPLAQPLTYPNCYRSHATIG